MSVTIKHIAAEAGVSFQAVSAVLNNKTNCRVSPATRERILNIARDLDYKVNFGYRIMRGQVTRTVGIISAMRQLEKDAHVRELVLKLIHRINLKGYATYFNNMMSRDVEANLAQIRELISRGTEHFIFIGSPLGHELIEQEIIRRQCTLIGWNSYFTRDLCTNSSAASLEIQRFLMQKSGMIPRLMLPGKRYFEDKRFAALQMLCPGMSDDELWDKYVIQVPGLQWEERDFSKRAFELGYHGIAEYYAVHPDIRAVACFTDNFALGVAAWCKDNGLSIGKDIFLAGFNNIEAVRFYPYPISSAAHPVDESIDILLREMDQNQPFRCEIQLEVFLRS